jgi:hypothetical protein
VDDNNFYGDLWVVDASIGRQGKKILLFANNCATHLQDTSLLWKINFVYYPSNWRRRMPSMRNKYG